MVTQYGMTERLGAISYGQEQSEVFLGRDMGHIRDYSEEVAAAIDEEVRAFIETAHQEAYDILVANRDVLDALVLALLERETLDKAEIEEIFAELQLRAAAPGVDRLGAPPARRARTGAHARGGRGQRPRLGQRLRRTGTARPTDRPPVTSAEVSDPA